MPADLRDKAEYTIETPEYLGLCHCFTISNSTAEEPTSDMYIVEVYRGMSDERKGARADYWSAEEAPLE